MSSIYERLRADVVVALKARDSARATILRTNDAAIQRAAMDSGQPIDDALVIATLRKAVKNLVAANEDFARGGRQDLIETNLAEIRIIEAYLPQQIDGARLEALVDEAIRATGAQSKRDMGKVIGALKQSPDAGQIDFGAVSKLVQARLP
jgi:uncharacterized protein